MIAIIIKRISRRLIAERRGLVCYRIQKEACIHVFWKALRIGTGPAASLYIRDREVLKADCFGEGKGHYHLHVDETENQGVRRLYFSEKTVKEQVERSIIELTDNLETHLKMSTDPKIRDFVVRRERIQKIRRRVREKMLEYGGKTAWTKPLGSRWIR